MSNNVADVLVVYKGGPNNGIVVPAPYDMGVKLKSDKELTIPSVGARYMTAPHWWIATLHTVGLDRAKQAWKRIGIDGVCMAIYEVESFEDGILVWAYKGDHTDDKPSS